VVIGVVVAIAISGLFVGAPAAQGLSEPSVSCESCFVIDDQGRVLWGRAAHTRLPNASTTKMVTALEVLENVDDLKEEAVVSSAAGSVGGGGLDLQPGDRLTVRNLLFAMLLSSSNEAAATLAEHVSGTQDAFVEEMNGRVRELGLKDTHFANPHGFDAEGHYSSAADLAAIGAALLAEPYLARIVRTPSTVIRTPRGDVQEVNRNLLLETYPGAIGIKTGRTIGAGNVLVAAARRGDRRIIAVAMRAADATADTRAMLDYGFERARRLDRPHSTQVLGSRTSLGALIFDPSGAVEVVASDQVTVDLANEAGPVEYEFSAFDITPPLKPGQAVGTLSISSNGEPVAEVDAVIVEGVERDESGGVAPKLLGGLMKAVAAAVAAIT
jgi:D-alanyl-D-alanine carboxypeptidase